MLREIFIAMWYGLMFGISAPVKAYQAGKTYGNIVAILFGLGSLAVYPLSFIIGMFIGSAKYLAAGGPNG